MPVPEVMQTSCVLFDNLSSLRVSVCDVSESGSLVRSPRPRSFHQVNGVASQPGEKLPAGLFLVPAPLLKPTKVSEDWIRYA